MTLSSRRGARAARPRAPYSEALAEAICDAAAEGRSLAAICRRRAMPPRSTVEHWLKTRPDFAEAYGLALAAGGGKQKGGRPSGYSLETAVELCRRLGEGEALHRLCRDPVMPSQTTVYMWVGRHPEFAAMMSQAREIQAQTLFDEVREIADGATPETLQVDRTRITARQWQAARLAPRAFGAKPGEGGKSGPTVFNVEVIEF